MSNIAYEWIAGQPVQLDNTNFEWATGSPHVLFVGDWIFYKERLLDAYLEEKLDISGKTEEALVMRAILKKTLEE